MGSELLFIVVTLSCPLFRRGCSFRILHPATGEHCTDVDRGGWLATDPKRPRMPNILDLQRAEDPRDLIHRAVQVLAEGGIVGIPTDALYGMIVSGLNPAAVEALADASLADCRCGEDWLEVVVPSAEAAWDYMNPSAFLGRRLARRCWPGPVTLVTRCDSEDSAVMRLPDRVRRCLVDETGSVAIRVVSHSLFRQLHRFLAGPLVLANGRGEDGTLATTCREFASRLGNRIPLILDDGPTRYGGPTTVVRVVENHYEILREGAVESAAIHKFAKPLLVLVCTGNTCRSPMAECLMRARLAKLTGKEDAVTVVSAGLAAFPGDRASSNAVDVMQRQGLDLSEHSSQVMTEQLLGQADLVLTMTRGHREAILSKFPDAADRVFTVRVDGGDIADPVGAPVEAYEACANQIDSQLMIWADRIVQQWFDKSQEAE